jgi:hypothetical protein
MLGPDLLCIIRYTVHCWCHAPLPHTWLRAQHLWYLLWSTDMEVFTCSHQGDSSSTAVDPGRHVRTP